MSDNSQHKCLVDFFFFWTNEPRHEKTRFLPIALLIFFFFFFFLDK